MRTWKPALILLALASWSCSETSQNVCTPGATQACVCPGGTAGAQACEKDGKSWGACYGCGGDTDGGVRVDGTGAGDAKVSDAKATPDHATGGCTKPADLLNLDACGPGKACGIVDSKGTLGCAAPGTTAFFKPCTDQGSCVAGSGCMGLSAGNLSCLPFCDKGGTDTCPKGSSCTASFHTTAGDIGLCMEVASCDIVTGTGCSGTLGCYIGDTKGNPICLPPGSAKVGESCATSDNCIPGLVCAKLVCRRLCHDDAVCVSPDTCKGKGIVFSAAPTVGICTP